LALPVGIEATLGTIAIAGNEGSVQVTYNGVPLYTHRGDRAPGDTNGQGVDEVWSVIAP
jgi:predicted lipoprotein with Yx(FWY)xxD motif